jgi:trans-aconitate methyltransferase
MKIELADKEGKVTIIQRNDELKKITVEPYHNTFIPVKNCETFYPLDLIELIFSVKGAGYLCDEICRDIDPNYVRRDLEEDLTAYFAREDFSGKRILDFGCGSGASSMVLARMFPDARITGIELEEKLLEIARARLSFYQYANVEFHLSPSGMEIPQRIGEFDFVVMSAVFEHLLPEERKTVIPKVWEIIKSGGFLFLNMTPHRWFPVEHHTTGLPFINYLPANLTYAAARRFSKRLDGADSWETLLRRGIRGATENEIIEILTRNTAYKPVLIEPSRKNLKNRIDLWYSLLNRKSHRKIKKVIKILLKTIRAATGLTLVPNLSLAIKKVPTGGVRKS